jgi:hypothetical protein
MPSQSLNEEAGGLVFYAHGENAAIGVHDDSGYRVAWCVEMRHKQICDRLVAEVDVRHGAVC